MTDKTTTPTTICKVCGKPTHGMPFHTCSGDRNLSDAIERVEAAKTGTPYFNTTHSFGKDIETLLTAARASQANAEDKRRLDWIEREGTISCVRIDQWLASSNGKHAVRKTAREAIDAAMSTTGGEK